MTITTIILATFSAISLIYLTRNRFSELKTFDNNATLPLRGLLALLLVAHHLGQSTDIPILSNITKEIGLQIVAVFFFISGYGLCISYTKKRQNYLDGFLRKRLNKLLPKLIILTLIMAIAYHIVGISDILDQVRNLINNGDTPLPFSWFIYAIIYVYVSFYISARIGRKPLNVGIIFLFSIILYILILSKIFYYQAHWWQTILCVILGYFVALYNKKITTIISNSYKQLFPMIIIFLLAFSYLMIHIKQHESVWIISCIFTQLIALYAIITTIGFSQAKWLCIIGSFSLELYLVHGIPLVIAQQLNFNDYLMWIFTYSVALPLAISLSIYYNKITQFKFVKKQS